MLSEDAISIGDYAKIIKYGQNRLFAFLREKKILKLDNIPYQAYIDNNYFKVIEEVFQVRNSDGVKTKINLKTLITPKGQEWFINKYRKEIR
jgi:phage antirepressor YoqD-like protein